MEGLKNDTAPRIVIARPRRGRAISGRHCRFVPVAVKMAKTKSQPAAAVTAQPLAALPPYGCGVPFTGSERHWQLQIPAHSADRTGSRNCHCEGALRPWQSREGSYVFAGSAQLSGQVLRDSHVASLLGMTRQASAAVHQCLSAVECSPYWAVTDRRYIFLSSGGLCRDRRCGRNRPIHPDRYSVHHAGTQPGHSDSFPAACFSCCFFRVFPA